MKCPICHSESQVWDGYCHRVSCEVFVEEAEEALRKYREYVGDETATPFGIFWVGFRYGRKTDLSAGEAWDKWHEGEAEHDYPSTVNPVFSFGHRCGREVKEAEK